MSLFPDQCADDILKNGRRRFANHSGCCLLHYDAISLMSKNNVAGWGGNRIRGSERASDRQAHSLISMKPIRSPWILLLALQLGLLWPHFCWCFPHKKLLPVIPEHHALVFSHRCQIWAAAPWVSLFFCSPQKWLLTIIGGWETLRIINQHSGKIVFGEFTGMLKELCLF